MEQEETKVEESKANKVIKVKIQSRKDEIESIGYGLPVITIGIGILIFIFGMFIIGTIPGWIVGTLLVIAGGWWYSSKNTREKQLQREIKELEAELD